MKPSNPKTAKSSHEHNFTDGFDNWEASVFDNAMMFIALTLGPIPGQRQRTEFSTFEEAVTYAKDKPDHCVYAITASGRSVCLDRKNWSDWLEREKTK